jgi:c-di-GMP-binding flagellar brake protein YcgR
MAYPADRRKHPRTGIERPCKIFHQPSRRYLSGQTCDFSANGALIRVDSARPLTPGDEIGLAVAWSRKAVLDTAALTPARVVRVTASLGRFQAVAIEFAQDQALRLAA